LFHQKNKDEDAFSILVKQRNIEQIFLWNPRKNLGVIYSPNQLLPRSHGWTPLIWGPNQGWNKISPTHQISDCLGPIVFLLHLVQTNEFLYLFHQFPRSTWITEYYYCNLSLLHLPTSTLNPWNKRETLERSYYYPFIPIPL
jgi:hypothetical protein